jgi:hypothetical protein
MLFVAAVGGVVYAQSAPCIAVACSYIPLVQRPVGTVWPTPTIHVNTPTPTSTPVPAQPGDVLYQADWSSGLNGWLGAGDWKTVGGMLVNDGSGYDSQIFAPYQPGLAHNDNYAIEAEIQLVRYTDTTFSSRASFSILARVDTNKQGYQIGACAAFGFFSCGTYTYNLFASNGSVNIADAEFNPGTEWHTYRAEMVNNTIKVLLDGNVVLQTTDNIFLSGGRVGLSSYRNQINVRSFRVIKL